MFQLKGKKDEEELLSPRGGGFGLVEGIWGGLFLLQTWDKGLQDP